MKIVPAVQKYGSFFECFQKSGRPVITAHATFIGRYPCDSLAGIQGAVDVGADFVEFDVRCSKDGIPMLSHDMMLNNFAGRDGRLDEFTCSELQKMNISHYEYFRDCSGRTRPEPFLEHCPFPRLDEVFTQFGRSIFMNIQIYEKNPEGLKTICRLFHDFDLYDHGYFTVSNFEIARLIREMDSDIELCVLNRPLEESRTTMAMLHDFRDFGCRLAQPRWFDITPEYCETSHELGIYSNVYYANYERDVRYFTECGIDGILTDYPDLVLPMVLKK